MWWALGSTTDKGTYPQEAVLTKAKKHQRTRTTSRLSYHLMASLRNWAVLAHCWRKATDVTEKLKRSSERNTRNNILPENKPDFLERIKILEKRISGQLTRSQMLSKNPGKDTAVFHPEEWCQETAVVKEKHHISIKLRQRDKYWSLASLSKL